MDEIKHSLLPGKKHTRVLPYIFFLRDYGEDRLNENNIMIGEVCGNHFWMMYTTSTSVSQFYLMQCYFSGRVIEGKNGAVILGCFLPQPSMIRTSVVSWIVDVVLLFLVEILITGSISALFPAVLTLLYWASFPIFRLIARLFSLSENRKVRNLLRQIASEEGEGSCAS